MKHHICVYNKYMRFTVIFGVLYPYGQKQGDQVLQETDDGVTKRVWIPHGFQFNCERYRSVYVSSRVIYVNIRTLPLSTNDYKIC